MRHSDMDNYAAGHTTRSTTLDNGLTIITSAIANDPAMAMVIRVAAGHLDNKPGKYGTAHLLEHLLMSQRLNKD